MTHSLRLSEDNTSVQILTALVMQLIQSCTGIEKSENKVTTCDDVITPSWLYQENKEGNNQSHSAAVSCANAFVSYFVKQWVTSSCHFDFWNVTWSKLLKVYIEERRGRIQTFTRKFRGGRQDDAQSAWMASSRIGVADIMLLSQWCCRQNWRCCAQTSSYRFVGR